MARPADMHTKDYLAQELRAAGLDTMADRAASGWYHDFLSPLATPEMELDRDLIRAINSGNKAAVELRRRHHNGEFDASKEESDDWAASPDGQAVFRALRGDLKGKP